MDEETRTDLPFEFTDENVEKLKKKYSQEMKDDKNNPIKVCMQLIYEAAIEKNRDKRLELSLEFSEFITKPDGIINLFLALIDFDKSSQKVTTHIQRFWAVSQIVACSPKLCMPYEKYCDNITKQLRPLLVHQKPVYVNLASILISCMMRSPHSKDKGIEKVIFKDMFTAIQDPQGSPAMEPGEALLALLNMFQYPDFREVRVILFSNFFYCYVALCETPSHFRPRLKQYLISVLEDLGPGPATYLLEKTLFVDYKTCDIYDKLEREYEISIRLLDSATAAQREWDKSLLVEVATSLIESSHHLMLESSFHFQILMRKTTDERTGSLSADLVTSLLIHLENSKLDIISSMAQNFSYSFDLLSRTLLSYTSLLKQPDHDLESQLACIRSSLMSCLDIMTCFANAPSNDVPCDRVAAQRRAVPILKELVSVIRRDRKRLCDEDETLIASVENLIGDIELIKEVNEDSEYESVDDQYTTDEHLQDLRNKLVPVRVHALVRLKQLVQANNKYVLSQIATIYKMVESLLTDQDSYVFLACINLVVEMTLRRTNEILPKLLQLYSHPDSNGPSSSPCLSVEQRVNVGEALVRLFKQLNETAPWFADGIMRCLYKVAQEDDELMQISSLVNIGEISKNLGDSLGIYMLDILERVRSSVESDSVEVRCAAIDLLRTTLSGLDRLKVESVQRELSGIYGLLKRVRSKTLDERLTLQADLALDEIDRIARDLILREDRKLVKNIEVLSLLDNGNK